MIRALLDRRKRQTRRIIKFGDGTLPSGRDDFDDDGWPLAYYERPDEVLRMPCPYGSPGDLLWARESFCCGWAALPSGIGIVPANKIERGQKVVYRASSDYAGDDPPWRPSIHMPRWASRLTLLLNDVRVERLQEIDEADALAEGVAPDDDMRWNPVQAFEHLWSDIHGPDSWAANPWVWALSFEVIQRNVDDVLKEVT